MKKKSENLQGGTISVELVRRLGGRAGARINAQSLDSTGQLLKTAGLPASSTNCIRDELSRCRHNLQKLTVIVEEYLYRNNGSATGGLVLEHTSTTPELSNSPHIRLPISHGLSGG